MSLQTVGNAIAFYFKLTEATTRAGKTGLLPLVDVYKNRVSIVSGASAVELARGVYYYVLAAGSVDVAGDYLAQCYVTDATVDQQEVDAFWQVLGSLDLTESGDGTGITLTLAGLRWALRVMLNDIASDGSVGKNYRTSQLDLFINMGYRDTMFVTKCHKSTKALTLVAGTHTYDCAELFEPIEVALSESQLKPAKLGEQGMTFENWNNDPAGVPDQWMQLSGSSIRIHPAPSSASCGAVTGIVATPTAGGTGYTVGDVLSISTGGSGATVTVTSVNAGVVTAVKLTTGGTGYTIGAGKATTGGTGANCTVEITTVGTLTVHGYAHASALTLDAHSPDGLPDAHAAAAILSRAAWYARRSRAVPTNLALMEGDDATWKATCQKIIEGIKAGS